ncbi:MAG: aminoacetone oxidase family FAD-binding enzyme [Bacilli bacterium]|nr:aminoacetone oxidase family FAD-binding enzyme [Bacilli bacterium]
MKKVVIVGGGASGVIASIFASKNNEVIILERNSNPLKKLLLTGNGKCNYFNDNQDISNYNSSNIELIEQIVTKNNLNSVLDFFDRIGIVPKIKNGYYYPYSNLSNSIKEALLKEANLCGVKIKTDYLVEDIKRINNKFIINNELECDYLILSTGSKACPKTGSDGIGYDILKKLGHKIIKVSPALTQVIGNESYFKDWAGIRAETKVSLYENDKYVTEQIGEVQFTKNGLSGICIFNLSGKIRQGLDNNNKEDIIINFLPFVMDIEEYLNERNKRVKNRTIIELLEGLINYKLVKIILKKSNISENKYYNELTREQKINLYNNLVSFKVNIIDTNDFDSAQTCSGGVSLEEINLNTMESKLIDGLFITGELLDIDGLCGGYNLTIAWISGILAGNYIGELC